MLATFQSRVNLSSLGVSVALKIVLEKNDAFIIKTSSPSGSLDVVLSVLENAIN